MGESDSETAVRPADGIGRMEIVISTLLRAGILTSLMLVLAGVVVTFIRHPDFIGSREALEHLKSDHSFPTRLGEIFKGVVAGQGRSIILLGVFVLFLTPVMRVAASIVAYFWEKDWVFALITSVVLLLLLASLLLGRAG